MKQSILILILVLFLCLAAEEKQAVVEQHVPGNYGGYEDICPTGIIIEGFEDEEEPIKFEHNMDFFIWLSEKLLGSGKIFEGMTLGITYSKLIEQQNIWEDMVEYELYESYKAASLQEEPGLNGVWKLDFRVWGQFYFQPELKYHHHQSNFEIEEFPVLRNDFPVADNFLSVDVNLRYINLPLKFRYEIKFTGEIKPFITIGPTLNYFVTGDADWCYLSNLENGNVVFEKHGSIDLDNLETSFWSISSTLGFKWRHCFIEVGFESNLTDLNNINREGYMSDSDGKVKKFLLDAYDYKHNWISLNMGFYFGK